MKGTDVYCAGSRRVREEWLSRCREERALTSDLLSEVTSLGNLSASLKRVISNKGSAGVDGMSVEELRDWFSSHHKELTRQLKVGSYRTNQIRGVKIPKPKGGYRQLGIPTVKDRLVQQGVHQILEKVYDPTFSKFSYGFRKGKGTESCLQQACSYVKEGYRYIVDIDLASFFDEVNHDRLLWTLEQRIGDRLLLQLICKFLKSGILEGGLNSQRRKGTPQGSPLSPLLSNIVLDELDKELERRGLRFVRYADDLIIFTRSRKASKRVMGSVTRFIEERMKLKVNKDKSGIRVPYELNFLGHSIVGKGELGLSKPSLYRLKSKLKEKTKRNRGISLDQMVKELNLLMRGWLNYFKGAKMKSKLKAIMSWLRRRIRCFRLKQCKRAIGIVRFLKKLKVPEWRSWLLALSSKGWFHKSCTPQAHEAMNYDWFTSIGLFDLYTYYCSKLMKPPST
ncbi:group II intron reverse transcriptase/maturase [Aquimarina sp. ERC-38]|uniref:group II intron reverse transcriptase/maturase n=1 Tax=Aquimarina sp. ERC-38 TaxID=2949996 RepID=UPI0022464ED5|nr:group II intron reverse transcriptase/maturase [Aquimarina sp. ERC-38]UZO80206.1 group II intron reverse transcriptase/maturase [Aquimarina sp. ERC-38]